MLLLLLSQSVIKSTMVFVIGDKINTNTSTLRCHPSFNFTDVLLQSDRV